MAKIPSRGFPKAKRKLSSGAFPKAKSKLASKKFAKGTTRLASRPAKAPKAASKKPDTPPLLDRPAGEKALQDRLANLKRKLKLRPASDLPSP